MNDSIGIYLNDIGKVPLLTAEDERVLSRAIEKGREAAGKQASGDKTVAVKRDIREAGRAKDRFIRANLRLVVSIARRYPLPQGMDLLDLIQEGNLGLEHAVDKFDWRRGFKFSTYATFWIRQAIGRALDQKASLIRIPGDRSASLRAALRQASGDGETLDLSNAELHRLTTPVSLDKTIGDDGDATLGDLMANGDPTPDDPNIPFGIFSALPSIFPTCGLSTNALMRADKRAWWRLNSLVCLRSTATAILFDNAMI